MKHFLTTLFLTFLSTITFAQYISGSVKDLKTGEPLIGAFVKVTELQLASEVDVDGSYLIKVPKGTYTLEASYFSYDTVEIGPINVVTEDNYRIDINMEDYAMELDGVVVAATQQRSTEVSLITLQRNSVVLMDGVSNQQIQRMGDGDVGQAARRVSGVSVEGGRYLYVRGLGDRYSKTLLNGAEIPSLDPNRNSVQLDMFPTNMIDNISVLKTFSVDKPGDFTGGCAIINTRGIPDKFTLNFGVNFGYNTNSTFNSNFLSSTGGSLDFLGLDDGTRQLPNEAQGTIPSVHQNPIAVDRITRSFNSVFTPSNSIPPPNVGLNFTIGNKWKFRGNELGLMASLSYNNEYEYFENGENNRYILATAATGALSPTVLLNDREGKNTILGGIMLGSTLKHRTGNINFNFLRSASSISSARYMEGTNPLNTDDDVLLQSNVLRFVQRSLNFAQLTGDQNFGEKLNMNWTSSFTFSDQDEPDFRSFTNSAVVDPTDGNTVTYSVNPANYKKPSRFFRNMDEWTIDNKLNFIIPFESIKLSFGGSYLQKQRTFRERRLDYEGTERFVSSIGLMDIFSNNHIGIVGTDPNGNLETGIHLLDATERRNQYNGSQRVVSGFVMADYVISEIKINFGLRSEWTTMDVASFSTGIRPGNINTVDFLPAINFIYSPSENTNVRLSYSRTLARPNFREMAPFASFDFNQDNVVVGNPNLRRVLSDNVDLRFEWYPTPSDIISVSAFQKTLQNPIERIFSPVGFNEVTWRNVPNGRAFGLEFEVRKKMDFVKILSDFTIGTNLTLVKSQVDIDPAELARFRAVLGPEYPSTRRLFAQSPYLLNSFISYANAKIGTEVNLNLNVFGERLAVVGTGTAPDVYEQPRPMLNFMVSQKFGKDKKFKLTFRCNNLLDATFDWTYRTDGPKTTFQRFNLGREFQIGFNYSL